MYLKKAFVFSLVLITDFAIFANLLYNSEIYAF